jgi:hypothetical protein
MKLYFHLTVLILFSLFLSHDALADYLEVHHTAKIKHEAQGDSEFIEKVEKGALLELLDNGAQTNGYYHVKAYSFNANGWIYRTLVRRHKGEIPTVTSEPISDNPLADQTLTLTPETRRYAARHLKLGKPQAIYERIREGYVLCQDARLKIPLWVQYELSLNDLDGPAERSDDFRPDTSIPFNARAELSDYRGSGYDRGHMAPAADMNRSRKVMSESFLLSNMSPQIGPGFNRAIWAELEASVRGWVRQRGPLTIITGPIFKPDNDEIRYKVIGKKRCCCTICIFQNNSG